MEIRGGKVDSLYVKTYNEVIFNLKGDLMQIYLQVRLLQTLTLLTTTNTVLQGEALARCLVICFRYFGHINLGLADHL